MKFLKPKSGALLIKHLLGSAVALLAINSRCLAARMVLDDFDRSDITIYTDPFGFDYKQTTQVGELQSIRRYRLAESGAIVQGMVTVNQPASAFQARIDSSIRRTPQRPDPGIFGVVMTYDIPVPTDLRQGGNDSLVFEFDYQRGLRHPTFFRAIVGAFDTSRGNRADSFQFHMEPPPVGDGPFRVIMPFEQFTPRGGGAQGVYTPSYLAHTISVDYYFLFVEGQFDWSTSINRIYFANAASIPEPSSAVITGLLIAISAAARTRVKSKIASA
jgi:hypothetical protein